MEKNHKHEIGVEMAHHKETQKNYSKLIEENKELRIRLEEKERALDISNIYSRQNGHLVSQTPVWKASSQSLNNVNETPRKDNKKKDSKHKAPIEKTEISNLSKLDENYDLLEKQKEDLARFKKIELEREKESKRQEELEAEKKRKENAEKREKAQREREREKEEKQKRDEEERKQKEKDLLEEEDRKKRWISQNTVNNMSEVIKEKNVVEKTKKDELLAKLSMIDNNTFNTTSTTSNKPKEDESVFKFNNTENKNSSVAGFGGNSSNNKSSLPPKPSNTQNKVNDFNFTTEIVENRDSNKNDLLSKLFGNTPAANSNSNKANKNDDLFGFKSPTNNTGQQNANKINSNSSTSISSNKINQLQWDTQDYGSNARQTGKNSVSTNNNVNSLFGPSPNSNAANNVSNGNKNEHFDFFSKLNSNTNAVNSGNNQNQNQNNGNGSLKGSGGINRPKLDNKILFSSNIQKSNNYVEDIEEFAL